MPAASGCRAADANHPPSDICPADRRCFVAARLDAIQEVREIGFQVYRIVVRRHTVDARSTILAGYPVGFFHPLQIDDVVQRTAPLLVSFLPVQLSVVVSWTGL
jgi:hypothetical protein